MPPAHVNMKIYSCMGCPNVFRISETALHALRRAACIVLTIMNEIVSKSAGQYSDHIAVRKKGFICGNCRENRVLCVKTWVISFVLMRAHYKGPFFWVLDVYVRHEHSLFSS